MDKIAQLDTQRCGSTQNRADRAYKPDRSRKDLVVPRRDIRQQPDTPKSGAISHSRACFASEKRKERTCVRDLSSERSKARSGKARSLREQKKFPASCYSPIVKFTVPSPLEPLTTVFGKGTCVSAPLWTPEKYYNKENVEVTCQEKITYFVRQRTFFFLKLVNQILRKKVVKPHG